MGAPFARGELLTPRYITTNIIDIVIFARTFFAAQADCSAVSLQRAQNYYSYFRMKHLPSAALAVIFTLAARFRLEL
jgi:hypothetical protein